VYVPFVTFLLLFSSSRATISELFPPPGFTRVYSEVAENSDQDNEGDRHPQQQEQD
jgi:hypothetical protein